MNKPVWRVWLQLASKAVQSPASGLCIVNRHGCDAPRPQADALMGCSRVVPDAEPMLQLSTGEGGLSVHH